MIRLLVTSGRGPAECRIALGKTLRLMRREAAAAGVDLDVAEGEAADRHGAASALVIADGEGTEAFARAWTGSVQWTFPSPLRPHHKRKNWFVGVLRLDAAQAAPAPLDPNDVVFETMRAGGPGGQHQNKTESAVRATHRPSGLAVVARDGRSQHRNKAIALERLAELLRLAADLAALTERADRHAGHDRVERGQPVRRFTG